MPFDFSLGRTSIPQVVGSARNFYMGYGTVQCPRGEGLGSIKKQVADDVALFCNDKGVMIAMSVDT